MLRSLVAPDGGASDFTATAIINEAGISIGNHVRGIRACTTLVRCVPFDLHSDSLIMFCLSSNITASGELVHMFVRPHSVPIHRTTSISSTLVLAAAWLRSHGI